VTDGTRGHPVHRSGSTRYNAGPGWDPVTGWGSPSAQVLDPSSSVTRQPLIMSLTARPAFPSRLPGRGEEAPAGNGCRIVAEDMAPVAPRSASTDGSGSPNTPDQFCLIASTELSQGGSQTRHWYGVVLDFHSEGWARVAKSSQNESWIRLGPGYGASRRLFDGEPLAQSHWA
jgi:hypothetical protein